MTEVHKRVASVTPVALSDETTADLLTGATVIPLANSGDFYEGGGRVLIAGEVYTYSEIEEGEDDDTPDPSITLDSGLLADLPSGSVVEEWDPSANGGAGAVAVDYMVDVTDDVDGSPGTAYLHYTLIPMLPEGLPPGVGDSVVVRIDDDDDWWVVNVVGRRATVGFDHVRTGTLDVDQELTVGTPDAQRVVIKGTPAIELYNATNEQTGNLDGEENFLQGSIGTDAPGNPRVEVGQGSTFIHDAQEVRLYTEDADEVTPGAVTVDVVSGVGHINVISPEFDGAITALLQLGSGSGASAALLSGAFVTLEARGAVADPSDPTITLDSSTNLITIVGNVDATLGDGSIGTGTIASSAKAYTLIRDSNNQTGTTYTLALSDANKVVQGNHATGITITIPPNSSVAFPVGTVVDVLWRGAGTTTVATGVGVTLNGKTSGSAITSCNLSARWGQVRLWQRAADTWVITGDFV